MQTLDLVYVDPKALPALKKLPGYPPKPSAAALPLLGIPGLEGADENAVATLLLTGTPAAPPEIASAIQGNVRPDGRFAPPIVLVSGELKLVFDAKETLKVTVTTAIPFAAGDEELSNAIKAARDFLDAAGDVAAASVCESLSSRIRDCFARVRRSVGQDYLQREADRALCEQRRYRVGQYAGAPHARGLLAASDRSSLLCFIPTAALPFLPLSSKLESRLLAEAAPLGDQFESHPFALRLVALARQVQA